MNEAATTWRRQMASLFWGYPVDPGPDVLTEPMVDMAERLVVGAKDAKVVWSDGKETKR